MRIFSIHCLRQKCKRDGWEWCVWGWGRLVDGFSVPPSVRPWHGTHFISHVTLATWCSYPTRNNLALIFIFLRVRAWRCAAQNSINFSFLCRMLGAEIKIWNGLSVGLHNGWSLVFFFKFIDNLFLSESWQLKEILVTLKKHPLVTVHNRNGLVEVRLK